MLMRSVTFDDLDGNPVTETHYFHLNKLEASKMVEFEDIIGRLEAVQASNDTLKAFNLFEDLVLKAYGIREDSTHFNKSPEIQERFRNSLAFEALIFDILEGDAAAFVEGVLPASLVKQVKEELAKKGKTLSDVTKEDLAALKNEEAVPVSPAPQVVSEIKPPTRKDLTAMTREELLEAMKEKNEG